MAIASFVFVTLSSALFCLCFSTPVLGSLLKGIVVWSLWQQFFLYFNLKQKNSFYKQCWSDMVSILKIVIGKQFIRKTCNCVTKKRTYVNKGSNLLTVLLLIPLNRLPCSSYWSESRELCQQVDALERFWAFGCDATIPRVNTNNVECNLQGFSPAITNEIKLETIYLDLDLKC